MTDTTPREYKMAKTASRSDDKQMKDLMHSKYYKPYQFMVVAKRSTYSDRVDYTAARVWPHKMEQDNSHMIHMLNCYSAKETAV